MAPAADRIEQFLKDRLKGDLFVAVGYASTPGLSWLNQQTKGRNVTLLIGDARPRWFKQATAEDRGEALDFLRRDDVEVRNWYRTRRAADGERDAHLKVWAVRDRRDFVTAALVGSANLSDKGLHTSVEVIVEARGEDLRYVVSQIKPLFKDGWDCREKLIGYIERGVSPTGNGRRELGQEVAGDQRAARAGILIRAVTWPFRVIRTTASVLLKVLAVACVVTAIGLLVILIVGIARGWFG